jgi:putative peptide zinc metalloprotease protein
VLCPTCRVHTRKGFPFCLRCGRALPGQDISANSPSMLVPAGEAQGRYLTDACTTIGRGAGNDLTLADGYVSRHHARVWREPGGYRVEDLDSVNGTFVNGERLPAGGSRLLRDHDVIGFGPSSLLRIEQPRGEEIGGKTLVSDAGGTITAQRAAAPAVEEEAGTGLNLRPRRRSGWALKRVPGGGDARYVLRNTTTSAYLQLTERDRFLWDLMDGEHSVRDLLFGYAAEYGQLALPRIQQLLEQLNNAGLLARRAGETESASPGLGGTIVAALTRAELAVSGLDTRVEAVYRRLGWRFFTPIGLAVVTVLAIGGILALVAGSHRARLFDVGGAGIVGVVLAFAAYLVALLVHEMAHALAVKSYGRKVPRGGFMLMMGMPYAFVDTTDMWFEGRGPRIMVSLAGPVATAAMASFFAAGSAFVPSPVIAGVCFQVAFALYINTLFNFNPLIPLDGYYALSDWLGMPRLREEASAYFRKGLWKDLFTRQPMGRKQVGLAIYGMFAVVGMFLFLLLGIFSWTTRIGGLVHSHVPPPVETAIEVTLLLLLFFPMWYFPVLKLKRRIGRRLHREEGAVELAA